MEVRSIETIVNALNDAHVHYLIVGGLAVNAHGFARTTRDVDIVLQLEPSNAGKGLDALLQAGWQMAVPETPAAFADPLKRESWRREKNMIVLKLWSESHRRTPIDIFIYEPFDFHRELPRALHVEVGPGLTAPFVSLETLLQMKRDAGRPQDLVDIEELTRL